MLVLEFLLEKDDRTGSVQAVGWVSCVRWLETGREEQAGREAVSWLPLL